MAEVTRMQIVDFAGDAFVQLPITKHSLLAEALLHEAPGEVLAVLERLPETVFPNPRAVWRHLPDIPVGKWLA